MAGHRTAGALKRVKVEVFDCTIELLRQSDICVRNWPSLEHEFAGWRMFADGTEGEQVCKYCEMGEVTLMPRWGRER